MKRRLLKFIECKSCSAPFTAHSFEENGKEIKEGILHCKSCNQYYPIVNSIPRIIAKSWYHNPLFEQRYASRIAKICATKSSKGSRSAKSLVERKGARKADPLKQIKRDTVKNFGFEWLHFDKRGITDLAYNKQSWKKIFHEKTLFRESEISGKTVLDAGCGNGRFMSQALACGAEVFGFDLGPGVESAYQNTKHYDKVHIIQADIFNLPYKDEVFDFVFSIGVIHHTGNTRKAFDAIIRPLKLDGQLGLTCYHKGNLIWEFNDWWLRVMTLKMSQKQLMAFSRFLANTCKFFGPWVEKPMNLLFRWEPHTLNMFDWYAAPIATHHTYPEIYRWSKQSGIDVTEDLRWEKREWIRNIRFVRKYIAPDWAVTIKGTRRGHTLSRIRPTHIYDKNKIDWR